MPSMLILFFILALVITGAGLLLSPRSSARSPQNEYLVTPKGRRIVEAPPTRARSRRLNEGAGAGEAKQRVRGGSANANPVRRARHRVRRQSWALGASSRVGRFLEIPHTEPGCDLCTESLPV